MNLINDIVLNHVSLGSLKYEEDAEEEKNANYMEISIKTEINDVKNEVDIEKVQSSCDQLKSINIENAVYNSDFSNACMKHIRTKSCISLDKLEPDSGQHIEDMEIIKPEIDTSYVMERQNTVPLCEHNYCIYETKEAVEIADIKEEVIDIVNLSLIKEHSDSEYVKNITLESNNISNEVSSESIKQEKNVKEKDTSYDAEMSIKAEIKDIKDEVHTDEIEINYEQVKSIKVGDAGYERDCSNECMEHTVTKSCISLDELESDIRRCIQDTEIIIPELKEEKYTTKNIEGDLEKQKTVVQWEHDYCKYETGYVTRHSKHTNNIKRHKSNLQPLELNVQEPNLSYKNTDIIETEDIKEEAVDIVDITSVKLSSDIELVEKVTHRGDISSTEVGLAFMKYEQTIKEEESAYDTAISIKTEIDDLKGEIDTEEHALSCEQLKSIKIEDAVYKRELSNECMEDTSTKHHVSLETLEPERQYINNIEYTNSTETINLERNEEYGSDDIEVSKYKNNIQQSEFLLSAYKTEDKPALLVHFKKIRKGNMKYFKCKFCEYITDRMYSLKVHFMRIHNEIGKSRQYSNRKYRSIGDLVKNCRPNRTGWVQCHICRFETEYGHKLLKHYRLEHFATESFHCELCDYKTKYKYLLLQHRRRKHDDAAEFFHCELCDYETKDKSDLLRHHRTRHNDLAEIFHCELCDFKTKDKHCMSKHHRLKHDDTGTKIHCKLCTFETKYKHDLLKHHKLKHEVRLLQQSRLKRVIYNKSAEIYCCELCDFKTKRKYCFLQHYKSQHDDSAEVFHCELCDYKTKDKSNLSRHHRRKHDDSAVIFHCELCDFETKEKYKVSRHHRLRHSDTAKIFLCELCDFKTKYKYGLVRHRKIKHDNSSEVFLCKLCDFKTKYKKNLLIHHRSIHGDPEFFYCELCDYKCKYKSNLGQHRLKHDSSVIFHCELCDFKTIYKHKVLQHQKVKH